MAPDHLRSRPPPLPILRHVRFLPWFACSCLAAALPPARYVSDWGDQWVETRISGRVDSVPGEASSPHPTLEHLSLIWNIEGDDNLNGQVDVSYRTVGSDPWLDALPLRRIAAGTFKDGDPRQSFFAWSNQHAGSILDLKPGIPYEVRLVLRDPDGGGAETTLRVSTRPVPSAGPTARYLPVTPQTFAVAEAKAEPGDVLLLAPGYYGFRHATRDGEPGRPIIIRADPSDRLSWPTANGRGGSQRRFALFRGFSLAGRKHVSLEGIASTDTIDLFGAEACAVMRCRIQAPWGIVSGWSEGFATWMPHLKDRLPAPPDMTRFVSRGHPRAEIPPHSVDCLISDNVVLGLNTWDPTSLHADGKNLGEGIEISGPGNVICYNRVVGFRDCISLMEGPKAVDQTSIDIYNNDIDTGADDGIEADYAGPNCRILRNRITNCMRGLALAPVLGGPVYVVRNEFFNTSHVWQFGRAGSGYVAAHNTSVKSGLALALEPHQNAFVVNNLFIGGGERPEGTLLLQSTAVPSRWVYDCNGYGGTGVPIARRPPIDRLRSPGELRSLGLEENAVRVTEPCFAQTPATLAGLFPVQLPADFALHPKSCAVDRGRRLPNLNDGWMGSAPDLGARELGQPAPQFGPRSESGP